MPTVVTCQYGQQFEAADWLAGREVPCPACGETLSVPSEQEPTEQEKIVELASAEPITRISVVCQCGKRFKAHPTLLGKTVLCPACGNSLPVQPAQELPAAFSQAPLDMSIDNYVPGSIPSMPLDSFTASYPSQSYGSQNYYSPANAAPSSGGGGPSFELGPRAIMALIACGATAIVLLLIAIIVPSLIRSFSAGTNVVADSSASSKPTDQTPGIAAGEKWTTFVSGLGEYSLDFPSNPNVSGSGKGTFSDAFSAANGMEATATLILPDRTEYGAGRKRLSQSVIDLNKRRTILNTLANTVLERSSAKEIYRKEIMVNGSPGTETRMEERIGNRDYEFCSRMILTTNYYYCVNYGTPKGKYSTADASHFLGSLRLSTK